MCGIVGYIGTQAATEILLAGLEKLEYRGYDSESPRSARERFTASGQRQTPQSARKLQHIENPSQIDILVGNSRQAGGVQRPSAYRY